MHVRNALVLPMYASRVELGCERQNVRVKGGKGSVIEMLHYLSLIKFIYILKV